MDDNRIGRIENETVVWPEVDILGNSYYRPPGQTVGIGDNRFVIVPIGMNKARLAELLAEFALPVKASTGKNRWVDESEPAS